MFENELSVAIEAAKEAGKIQLEGMELIGEIEFKEDNSPVTDIDKRCEKTITELLVDRFPLDGLLREEDGEITGVSGRKWVIDPLDGTRPFIRGIPTHGVLIALEKENVPVVGVMYLPALDCLCYASKGGGAFINRKQVRVSKTDRLHDAMGSALGFIENSEMHDGQKLFEVMKTWNYTYGFMDSYSYVCVAGGKLDVAISLLDKPWDCAAAACIVKEAGGRYSDIFGNETIYNGSVVFSNGIIHDEILRHFH